MEKICERCGQPAKLIPPNGKWGEQVLSRNTGKKYYPFYKCEACNWSLSSDPNPRKFTRKPQGSPNNAENNDKFAQLVNALTEIQAQLIQLQATCEAIEVNQKVNKEI